MKNPNIKTFFTSQSSCKSKKKYKYEVKKINDNIYIITWKKDDYERTYFLFISFVKARNIATVIVGGCSSKVPNDNMLFDGDNENLPLTIGVVGTLWSPLVVDAMDAGASLGRLDPGLFNNKKIHKKSEIGSGRVGQKRQAYLPCSLGATESNLRLGERRTLKLSVCNSFMCWCSIVALKESTEEVILEVGTISWVFVETFVEWSRWNRVWDISKRCSIKIREGKSISWKKRDFEHETITRCYNKTNLVQCFYVIANPLRPFSHRLGRSNVRAIRRRYHKSSFSSVFYLEQLRDWNKEKRYILAVSKLRIVESW